MGAIILNSSKAYQPISGRFYCFLLLSILLPLSLLAEDFNGQIFDDQNRALSNVHVLVAGTEKGVISDSLGFFRISRLSSGRHTLQISSMGYANRRINIMVPLDDGLSISLTPSLIQLSEITVSGSVVTDIKSPVTHSTLTHDEISEQHTVQDIPTLLMNEPGIYVTNDGGSGFGDSQIMIRGFDEKRLQVLVNNIPVNDPETKEVSWSSWSGLPEATQAIQVQRGVGTSLYGTGAVGGAINIITLDATPEKSIRGNFTLGQFGVKKLGLTYESGLLRGQRSLLLNLGYLEGSGWRESSFYRGLQYYLAFTQLLGREHFLKVIFHGAPQYHTLAKASLSAASYARSDQFAHDSLRLDGWGNPAFGFGPSFNGNVHVATGDLSDADRQNQTSLLDAIFMRSKIGASSNMQVGGYTLAGDRASLNSNISHRPQLELHHRWYINTNSKLTTTAYITNGLDYSDDVYPAWYIPRQSNGTYDYEQLSTGSYYYNEQVFEYRYYSDFNQIGILSSLSAKYGNHDFSLGLESRRWTARHAGEVLNTFGKENVGVPIGGITHLLQESDLFYDFITTKPQTTLFGHALWKFGQFQLMTNVQFSDIRFRVQEQIPSNNNYPNHLDPSATSTHGGNLWEGTASWDDDNDTLTAATAVQYSLWDYSKSFQYVTPRVGLSYAISRSFNIYSNYSIGVKEPEIKHFYGYGAPQDELELEKTHDVELGVNYQSRSSLFPLSFSLTYYNIDFAGKLLQITLPDKANTPGYDYAGHTYVPIGDARYAGLEFDGSLKLVNGLTLQSSMSQSSNTWGEPAGTAGAQKLYANIAVAGQDYQDVNANGSWDEGGDETALHRNFVKKHGARYDVGMPQFIWNNSLGYSGNSASAVLSLRYFKDLYVLENNADVLISSGSDNLYFTDDDEWSPTLPPVLITDFRLSYTSHLSSFGLITKLQISNLFDQGYWQRGDEFGLIPGASRVWKIGLEFTL